MTLPSGAASAGEHYTQTVHTRNGTYIGWCKCGWRGDFHASQKGSIAEQTCHRQNRTHACQECEHRNQHSASAGNVPGQSGSGPDIFHTSPSGNFHSGGVVSPPEAVCIGICTPYNHATNCPCHPLYNQTYAGVS